MSCAVVRIGAQTLVSCKLGKPVLSGTLATSRFNVLDLSLHQGGMYLMPAG